MCDIHMHGALGAEFGKHHRDIAQAAGGSANRAGPAGSDL